MVFEGVLGADARYDSGTHGGGGGAGDAGRVVGDGGVGDRLADAAEPVSTPADAASATVLRCGGAVRVRVTATGVPVRIAIEPGFLRRRGAGAVERAVLSACREAAHQSLSQLGEALRAAGMGRAVVERLRLGGAGEPDEAPPRSRGSTGEEPESWLTTA